MLILSSTFLSSNLCFFDILYSRSTSILLPNIFMKSLFLFPYRPITDVAIGLSHITSIITSVVPDAHASRGSGVNQSKATGNTRLGKSEGRHQILNSSNCGTSLSSAPSSGVHLFSSDPDFVPSQDSCLASAQGTIKHEVEMQCIPVEQMADTSVEGKSFAGRLHTLTGILSLLFKT